MAAKTTAENLAEGAVALRSLTLRNVLSFGAEAKVELGPLNVLIGPNGCGKSNLVDVVALLKTAATGELRDEFQGMGSEWVWKGAERDQNGLGLMGMGSVWNGKDGVSFGHFMEIRAGKGLDGYAVSQNEAIRTKGAFLLDSKIERADSNLPFRLGGDRGDRLSLLNPSVPILQQEDEKNHMQNFLAGSRRNDLSALVKDAQIYRNRQVGRIRKLNPLRRPSDTDMPNQRLLETLDNFAVVLNRVRLGRDKDITAALREFYEDARGVDIDIFPNQANLVLKEEHGNVPAQRMSDGTLNWLFLLTVLLDNTPPPPLVCLEEPETGLHPELLPTLAKMLIDASSRMQLIVTTHSETLVDCLTDLPEAVVVCDKVDGVTQMKRLRAEDYAEWKEEGLGTTWIRGAIGGTRW